VEEDEMRACILPAFVLTVLFATLFQPSFGGTGTASDSGPAGAIHGFIHGLNTADVDAVLEMFSDEATVFGPFIASPARLEGGEAIRNLFEPLFSQLRKSGDGPMYMNLEPRDVHVQEFGDSAVVTFHLGPIPADSVERPYSFSRRTVVVKRSADRWLIAHLHASNVLIPASEEDSP
jgi:ketosteroid isomerase-like protein